MDAVPVELIVESRTACPDAARARAALDDALAGAQGPRRAGNVGSSPHWLVTVRLHREIDLGGAEAVIADDAGREVARREVTERGRACVPLTRALGAWASLVLDQELARGARGPGGGDGGAPAAPALRGARHGNGMDFLLPTAPPPDHVPAASAARAVEVGASVSLRSGLVGSGTAAFAAPHVAFQVGQAVILRPSLLAGGSTDRVPTSRGAALAFTAYAARVDACRRIPGNYIDRRGIELDVCGGGEVAFIRTSDADSGARASLGPSAVLRGELAWGVALEVRAAAGANLARASIGGETRAPLLVAAGEVGVSTRWP
jgi:hypothetical protein